MKQQFLDVYDQELATTTRVLLAYPEDKLELRPHPKSKTARELAWVFVTMPGLGTRVWNDEFARGVPPGVAPPPPPDSWKDLLAALKKAHTEFRSLVASASDATLIENVHVLTAPKTMSEISRINWLWFLLHDQIHHRGQFSVYLRMADGKVPSIYGPTADEQWR